MDSCRKGRIFAVVKLKDMDYLKIYEEEHIKNGLSYSQIRKKYNIPRGTWDYYVRQKLGKNADQRKHRCNDSFFDVIDSEIKAYLLGFLYADGYISSDGRIGILLNVKDEEIVKLIQQFIAPNSEIKYISYQNFKRSPQVKIRFKSKRLYERLQCFGFTTDKTHTHCKILCKIPEPFKKDFIRGFTDGDGSVRYSYYNTWYKVGISWSNGVPEILEEIQDYFNKCSGHLRSYDTYYILSFEKKNDVLVICKELYENCTYYLRRKYINAINSIYYCSNTELKSKTKELDSV